VPGIVVGAVTVVGGGGVATGVVVVVVPPPVAFCFIVVVGGVGASLATCFGDAAPICGKLPRLGKEPPKDCGPKIPGKPEVREDMPPPPMPPNIPPGIPRPIAAAIVLGLILVGPAPPPAWITFGLLPPAKPAGRLSCMLGSNIVDKTP